MKTERFSTPGFDFSLRFESQIQASVNELWQFHSSAEALLVLTPPKKAAEFLTDDLRVEPGVIQKVKVRQFGIPMVWTAKIESTRPPEEFVDIALKSPFKKWRHTHCFADSAGKPILRDEITYTMPFGPLGRLLNSLLVERDLINLFEFRHQKTIEHFSKLFGDQTEK